MEVDPTSAPSGLRRTLAISWRLLAPRLTNREKFPTIPNHFARRPRSSAHADPPPLTVCSGFHSPCVALRLTRRNIHNHIHHGRTSRSLPPPRTRRTATELTPRPPCPQAVQIFAFGTSSWLALQSLPLLLSPSLIVSMMAAEPRRISDLETYLCRTLGLTVLAFALLTLLLTGALPLETTATKDSNSKETNPYASATLIVTTGYHALSAFYLYMNLTRRWSFAFTCGMAGSSALFAMGVWCLLFAGDKGRRSKTTGADKRTSGFPFKNEESAREKKRENKKRSMLRTKSKGE